MLAIPTQEQCFEVSNFMKILAHPQRLMILCQLSGGPKKVSDLEQLCGATQSAVSQFLARMKSEGLVDCKKYSRTVFYEIKDKRVETLIQTMHQLFCDPHLLEPLEDQK